MRTCMPPKKPNPFYLTDSSQTFARSSNGPVDLIRRVPGRDPERCVRRAERGGSLAANGVSAESVFPPKFLPARDLRSRGPCERARRAREQRPSGSRRPPERPRKPEGVKSGSEHGGILTTVAPAGRFFASAQTACARPRPSPVCSPTSLAHYCEVQNLSTQLSYKPCKSKAPSKSTWTTAVTSYRDKPSKPTSTG